VSYSGIQNSFTCGTRLGMHWPLFSRSYPRQFVLIFNLNTGLWTKYKQRNIPNIFTEIFRRLPQSLQTDSGIAPLIRPHLLPSTSLHRQFSAVMLSFDATPAASLNQPYIKTRRQTACRKRQCITVTEGNGRLIFLLKADFAIVFTELPNDAVSFYD
jgi:hypothetical protein